MFFGPEKETEEMIQVHCEAFVKMMQYIYGRHPHLVLNKITESKVYMELFNLNQRYELNNRKTILDSLQSEVQNLAGEHDILCNHCQQLQGPLS